MFIVKFTRMRHDKLETLSDVFQSLKGIEDVREKVIKKYGPDVTILYIGPFEKNQFTANSAYDLDRN